MNKKLKNQSLPGVKIEKAAVLSTGQRLYKRVLDPFTGILECFYSEEDYRNYMEAKIARER